MDDQKDFDLPALKAQLLESLGPDSAVYPVLVEQQFPHILELQAWAQASTTS